ncbi:MAG: DUF1330 domain-containing protein [Defluviimonas denitrificans]
MAAYWIAHVTVTDARAYAAYQAQARGVFEAHGGRFLARGGRAVTLEGAAFARHVIVEFPSIEDAQACYASDQYRAARALRRGAAEVQIAIVEDM